MTKNSEGDSSPSKTFRIIDANLNRLREGLRVLEDICRFKYDNKHLASSLKNLRHQSRVENKNLLPSRDIQNDILKESTESELQRRSFEDLITANIKRAQESSRVLEEVLKTIDTNQSAIFKNIRYELYQVEKEIYEATKTT